MARTRTEDDRVVDVRDGASTTGAGADETGGEPRHRASTTRPTESLPKRVMAGIKHDHVVLTGAGLAFFAFLALVPTLIAVVSTYGLVGNPDTVQDRVEDVAGALPSEARDLLTQQLESITTASSGALTVGLVVSLAAALWAVSGAMSHLVEAITIVYDERETRGFLKRRGLGLALGLGAIVFGIVAIAAMTIWPGVVSTFDLPSAVAWLARLAVWPVMAIGLAVALAVVYRVGPNRERREWNWITLGSGVAVALWVVASIGFQVYVANFGSYNETYGSLAAIVIMLLWLLISSVAVLVGAEINHEREREGEPV